MLPNKLSHMIHAAIPLSQMTQHYLVNTERCNLTSLYWHQDTCTVYVGLESYSYTCAQGVMCKKPPLFDTPLSSGITPVSWYLEHYLTLYLNAKIIIPIPHEKAHAAGEELLSTVVDFSRTELYCAVLLIEENIPCECKCAGICKKYCHGCLSKHNMPI